jgi:hypothetical protein
MDSAVCRQVPSGRPGPLAVRGAGWASAVDIAVAARYSRGANHLLRQAALYLKLQRLEHRLKPPTSARPLEKRRNGGGSDIHLLVPHLELLLHASAVRDDVEFPFLEVGDLVMISL